MQLLGSQTYTSSSANLSSDMKRLALLSNARPTIPHNITFAKFHSPDEKLDSDSTYAHAWTEEPDSFDERITHPRLEQQQSSEPNTV